MKSIVAVEQAIRQQQDDDDECYCAELLEEDGPCRPCREWQKAKQAELHAKWKREADEAKEDGPCPF